MRTKFLVDVHCPANSGMINVMANIAANHNGGIVNISLSVFEGYFLGQCAYIPYKEATVSRDIMESTITFSMDGKTPFITVRAEYYNDLQPPATTPLDAFTTDMDAENKSVNELIGGGAKQ